MLKQLGDPVAFANGTRLVTEVFHDYDDLSTVASVYDSGIAQQPLLARPNRVFTIPPAGGTNSIAIPVSLLLPRVLQS